MEDETFINKRITNKDVYDKLEKMEKRDKKILEHAKETNGKIAQAQLDIAALEARSIGVWVGRHPFKFTVFVIALMSLLVSDFRQPAIELLIKAFI